ncbi:15129_t:CDS:2 [Entrophospora sp. SA101]|nr:4699_t:CDS:2 [Entrophospora sp. SA101]CAJ0753795.1 15129_t:CDS:2 [Entrophospora sp. SA101]
MKYLTLPCDEIIKPLMWCEEFIIIIYIEFNFDYEDKEGIYVGENYKEKFAEGEIVMEKFPYDNFKSENKSKQKQQDLTTNQSVDKFIC